MAIFILPPDLLSRSNTVVSFSGTAGKHYE